MKDLPERSGVEKESSARATPSASRSADWLSASDVDVQPVVSGTGKSRQPTVKRGSERISRSSCDSESKSVRRIWTIGGGSTGRLSLSPAPHARAAMGCCRTWRW